MVEGCEMREDVRSEIIKSEKRRYSYDEENHYFTMEVLQRVEKEEVTGEKFEKELCQYA